MKKTKLTKSEFAQNKVDEAIEESFPASDPPAWTTGEHHREPRTSAKKNTEPSEQKITLQWERTTPGFTYEHYNRDATLTFGGGKSVRVSNALDYFGNAALVNSEELLIASLSFCYMQTLLAIASKQGYIIKQYTDHAIGVLGKNAEGKMSIIAISLHPKIQFEGMQPGPGKLTHLKEKAHEYCFIANTLLSKVSIDIHLVTPN